MGEVARRLVAFIVAACAVAYVVFFFCESTIIASEYEKSKTVWVRDVVKANQHFMSGMVMVPSTCTELIIKPEQISPVAYLLRFQTWESPSIECLHEPTARQFHTIVFAPAIGMQFIATMDDRPLPIIVTPIIPDK